MSTEMQSDDLERPLIRLHAKALGLVLGILFAIGIFVATNWILLKGGHINEAGEEVIGPNLALLGQFFLGYSVTFMGSIIGAAYAFALGTITGTALSWFYNSITKMRD